MSDKNRTFDKHQSSKYAQFVATMDDGTRLEANSAEDLNQQIKVHNVKLALEAESEVSSEETTEIPPTPKFDPFTGEPL